MPAKDYGKDQEKEPKKKLQYQPADLGVYVAEPGEFINTSSTDGKYEDKFHGKIVLGENGIWVCSPDGKTMTLIANLYSYSEELRLVLKEICQAVSNHFGDGVEIKQFRSPEERIAEVFEGVFETFSKGLPPEELGKVYGTVPSMPPPLAPQNAMVPVPAVEFVGKNAPVNAFTRNLLALKGEFASDDILKIMDKATEQLSQEPTPEDD